MTNKIGKVRTLVIPAVLTFFTFIVFKFICFVGYVPTSSMEPTLKTGSYIIGTRVFDDLQKGDIVVFNTHIKGTNGDRHYVKRIIALEGDTVEIKADETGAYYIYVNDVKLEEEYLSEGIVNAREVDAHGKITVPPGKFYYCGDNRLNSADSRSSQQFGSYEDIVGRVIFKYNPEEGVLKDLEPVKRP